MASDVGETVDWCCSLHVGAIGLSGTSSAEFGGGVLRVWEISGESDALLEGVIPANVVANDAGETLCQRCASHAGAVVVDLAPGDEFAGFGTHLTFHDTEVCSPLLCALQRVQLRGALG
ncbi:LOW QUALITY PROTEIN: hypothetical protein ACHAXT_000239 [Thalassiosira profunda]